MRNKRLDAVLARYLLLGRRHEDGIVALLALAYLVEHLQQRDERRAIVIAAKAIYSVTLNYGGERVLAPSAHGLYGIDVCIEQECGT